MKSCLIVLLLVLTAGCIAPGTSPGSPEEYELPGINDTTIYYLNLSTIQVVESVTNTTSAKFLISDDGDMNFRNPVAVDYSGKSVEFNISRGMIFGRSYALFNFNSSFSGFVAYTQSDGQDFSRSVLENRSIRIVLPAGYTTGSRFLGIAQPEPDNITTDSKGREVLIWKNPYPEPGKIEVKYYSKSAPQALLYLSVSLFVCVLAVYVYYYFGIRALRKKREKAERGNKK